MLRKLVALAHTCELSIIIHSHDSKLPDDVDATHKCIQILASCLERCYPVHVHCFNGGLMQHQLQISYFHNVHFCISPLILDSAHRHPQTD